MSILSERSSTFVRSRNKKQKVKKAVLRRVHCPKINAYIPVAMCVCDECDVKAKDENLSIPKREEKPKKVAPRIRPRKDDETVSVFKGPAPYSSMSLTNIEFLRELLG